MIRDSVMLPGSKRDLDTITAGMMAQPEPDEAELVRLASLSSFDYDRERESAAKRLQVRVGTLDKEVLRRRGDDAADDRDGGSTFDLPDPEPWPDPVDGARLLGDLVAVVQRHVKMPDYAPEAMAFWVMHAHAHDAANISPIIAITSPVLGCGKTTALTLLGGLCPRPLAASNITAAALFRAVERWQPSLLVDEADTFLRDSDELRGVLNSGHNRASAFVIRTTGEDHEPRQFRTWAPKAIACIGKLPDTLASRSIRVEMRRLAPGEHVDGLRADRLQHLVPLQRKAWRWAQDHIENLIEAEPVMPATLRGRNADNWRPLLAVADAAGGEWPDRARSAALALAGGDDAEAVEALLLADIRDIFTETGEAKMPSADIVEELAKLDARPWPEWRSGKPMTANQLARKLKTFGVQSRSIRLGDGSTPKGYVLSDFEDAFSRYLEPVSSSAQGSTPKQSATPPQVKREAGLSGSQNATPGNLVADRNGVKANAGGHRGGVADRHGESREVEL